MTVRRVDLHAGPRTVTVALAGHGTPVIARIGEEAFAVTVEALDDGVFLVTSGATRRVVRYASIGGRHLLHLDGQHFAFEVGHPAGHRRASRHHHDLTAPMPGIVTRVFVAEGQAIQAGDPLFVVEAMKTESLVRAPSAGRVTRVALSPGSQVEGGAIVVEVENAAAPDDPPHDEGSAS
ncbi:MAG: biotin/lipoyl-containing protein [Armatimonadota bacterium]|nr:biotin/lipoyl-containing protein [Armatimonadota bacterium]